MTLDDIISLLNTTATIETKIEILPKVAGESIITLTQNDSIKKWTYKDLRNVPKEGFIGQFVARQLNGELQDISDSFNIEGREIVLYLGIRHSRGHNLLTESGSPLLTQDGINLILEQYDYSTKFYSLGNFFVDFPESNEVTDNTRFTALDYTILFNKKFDGDFKDSEYTKSFNEKIEDEETVTALWLLQYTCKQVGVLLGSTTFKNNTFVIDSNQFDDSYTCRDVVKSIAKLAFTWARIDWDNKLYLDFAKTSTVEDYNKVTPDHYYSLKTLKDAYGKVNRVILGSSVVDGLGVYVEDASSISQDGLFELQINDNPIVYTDTLKQTALQQGNSLFGLTYQPIDMQTIGHPWLKGNELLEITDMESNKLYTYPLDRTIDYDGHIKTTINSIMETEVEKTYSYEGVDNESKTGKRTKFELDREKQLLTIAMEDIEELDDDLHTNYVTNATFTVSNREIRSEISTTETTVKSYADGVAGTAETNAVNTAKGYTDTEVGGAKTYAEGQASTAESNAKQYADGVYDDAKDYADDIDDALGERVEDLGKTVEQNNKDLKADINTINGSLSSYAPKTTVETISRKVEEVNTSLGKQIEVVADIQENGVTKVSTTTGFTFDETGLTISKTNADTKTLIDEDGMTVYSTVGGTQEQRLNVDSDGVTAENLLVRTYTDLGTHTRIRDYEDGTGIFYRS